MTVSREQLDFLVQQSSFAADLVAMENRHKPYITEAQRTKAIIERALEFLIGNGLIEVVVQKEDAWLIMDPPYDATLLEPKS